MSLAPSHKSKAQAVPHMKNTKNPSEEGNESSLKFIKGSTEGGKDSGGAKKKTKFVPLFSGAGLAKTAAKLPGKLASCSQPYH